MLLAKHPAAREVQLEALVTPSDDPPTIHPIIFAKITGKTVKSAALPTQGVAGPSGIDAAGWLRLCTSFGKESADLYNAIATVARRLCTDYVDPSGLQAFLACRIIPLTNGQACDQLVYVKC